MAHDKHVLVVDDDADVLEQVRVILGTEVAVTTTDSGEEGLRIAAEAHPDLVILDVMMAHLSEGLDTAKALSEGEGTRDIPILMVTGVRDHFDYRTQIDDDHFPRDGWLDKPIHRDALLREVHRLLAR